MRDLVEVKANFIKTLTFKKLYVVTSHSNSLEEQKGDYWNLKK